MKRTRTYSPATQEAARLLGRQVREARLERRWTLSDLAERLGVNYATAKKVEEGDLSVGLGVAFEAATLLGVPLFSEDRRRRGLEAARIDDRLALLPKRARRREDPDDDF